jgi:Penicillin binding protein transpeptidase domain
MTGALSLFTRRTALGVSIAAIALVARGRALLAAGLTERADLEAVFAENGVAGTFVLYDVATDHLTLINAKRAERRFVPASTFKIANTIIALEIGVVKDENEIIPYGGQPQPFKTWEKDMSMREAIALSAVPIYQELARRIGLERGSRGSTSAIGRRGRSSTRSGWTDRLKSAPSRKLVSSHGWRSKSSMRRSVRSRLRATSFDLKAATAKSSTARPDGAFPALQILVGGPAGSNRTARFQPSR